MTTKTINLVGQVAIQASASADKPAVILVRAYTGGIVRTADLPLPSVVDIAGISHAEQIPLLLDHSNRIDDVAGTGAPAVRDNVLYVHGGLARTTAAAKKVIELVKAGVKLSASIGVEGTQVEHVQAGEEIKCNGKTFRERTPILLFRKSVLREVSIVPVGADSEATVLSVAASQSFRGNSMNVSATQQDAITLRSKGIQLKCQDDSLAKRLDSVTQLAMSGAIDSLRFEQELESIQRDDTKMDQLEQLRAGRASSRISNISGGAYPSGNDVLTLTAALCMNGNLPNVEQHFSERVLDYADSIRKQISLHSLLMRAAVEAGYQAGHGEYISAGNLRPILMAAFQPQLKAGAWSTTNIGEIVGAVANKSLDDGFQETAGDEWKRISDVKPLKNFHPASFYRMLEDA